MTEKSEEITFDGYSTSHIIAGQYKILDCIGKGGLGAVYKAEDIELNEIQAVKVFHPQLTQSQHVIDRFREKIKQVRQISSPGIVTLHSFGTDQGNYFLVMELVEGKNLEEILTNVPLPFEEARELLMKICTVLEPAHDAGLFHCNLKPRNIIITANQEVKIIDFGFAAPEDIADFPGLFDARYMAPEQIYPLDPIPAVDIYSLGIIFYQLLTGKTPFASKKPEDLAVEHANVKPPQPSDLMKDLPILADLVIEKLLHKEPKKRYRSVKHLRNVLAGNINVCPHCKTEHLVHTECPTCSERPSLLSKEIPGMSPMTQQVQVPAKKSETDPIIARLSSRKKTLEKNFDLNYPDHCFYCGKRLPFGFPICTECFQEAPFAQRGDDLPMIITGIERGAHKATILTFLKEMSTLNYLPAIKPLQKFKYLLRIMDDPQRAHELRAELQKLGAKVKPIDPDDLYERVRHNSWGLTLLCSSLVVGALFINMYLSVPFMIAIFYFVNKNLQDLRIPEVSIEIENLPGIFSNTMKKKIKELATHLKGNKFLLHLFESIVFRSFTLLEMMKKNEEAESIFSDIINSIEHIIDLSGNNIDALLIYEKNIDLAKEMDFKREIFLLEKRRKDKKFQHQWSVIDEKLDHKKGQQTEFYNTAKLVTDHYGNLVEIMNSLDRMKTKVGSITRGLITVSADTSQEDTMIQDVLTELTALEQGFQELES